LRSRGELPKDKPLLAFGGAGGGPVTIAFRVDEYLPKGVAKEICEPVVLPRGQMGNGIAASLVSLTVLGTDGKPVTRDFYIRRSPSYEPTWKTVEFPNEVYQVAYDVDRAPLGFELKLIDFDRGFDPGTEQASRFQSEVRLTDKEAGLLDRGHTIKMNEPLTHRGFTFYQASYVREQDPRTGRETGRVQSVLQVGKNPGRAPIYFGCILVVLGAFLQFAMRSGIFSDSGRRERTRSAARHLAEASASGGTVDAEVLAAVAGHSHGRPADDEPL
jgi:hypothetical protein